MLAAGVTCHHCAYERGLQGYVHSVKMADNIVQTFAAISWLLDAT